MKKLYIKFEEGNKESLKLACEEAERLGYRMFNVSNALEFEGAWLLFLDSDGEYFTSLEVERELILTWSSEHKLPPKFVRGERVLVRDCESQEWEEKIWLAEIEGLGYPVMVVTEGSEVKFSDWEEFDFTRYKFCKKLEVKVKEKKKMTVSQIEEALGFEILVSKD